MRAKCRRVEGGMIESVLLGVVAEKTAIRGDAGTGMALDADLGIDSIKRVEILSALQERLPDAPAIKSEHLGTLHTLGDIAAFLANGRAPALTPPPQFPPGPTSRRTVSNAAYCVRCRWMRRVS